MPPSKEKLRGLLRDRQDDTIRRLNEVLAGDSIDELEPILKRIGRGGELPHWYEES